LKTRAARHARIAAVTAAALLALFVGQPLHGPAAASGFRDATASFAADPGAATQGGHHAHLCPLCRAANQTRAAIAATPNAVFAAPAFHGAAIPTLSGGSLQQLALCDSGPRAPPTLLSPLV
jgi:hypothetical protein